MADELQANPSGEELTTEVEPTPKAEEKVNWEAKHNERLKELDNLQSQFKNLQRELSKRTQKLDQSQRLQERIDEIELGLATIHDKLDARPKDEFGEEEEKPKPKASYKDEVERKRMERQVQTQIQEFTNEATEAGLTEADTQAIIHSTRSFEEARLKLRDKLLEKERKTKEVTEQESEKKIQERVEAEVRKRLAESGVLKVETSGTPAGSSRTFQDIQKDFIAGKVSWDKYTEEKARQPA